MPAFQAMYFDTNTPEEGGKQRSRFHNRANNYSTDFQPNEINNIKQNEYVKRSCTNPYISPYFKCP